MGYFHLALAAATEDRANPEALYVVYMKLAEVHANHMPDAKLCQVYKARAQSLKRVLAREESAAAGEENVESDNSNSDVECSNIPFPSVNEFKDASIPRTCEVQKSTEDTYSNTNNVDETSNGHCEASVSETDTTGSRSHSDSILTESFDTAKEQISDSCSSSGTLQSNRSHADEKNFENGQGHIAPIPGDAYSPKTESNVQKDQSTLTEDADAHVAHADADNTETFYVKL